MGRPEGQRRALSSAPRARTAPTSPSCSMCAAMPSPASCAAPLDAEHPNLAGGARPHRARAGRHRRRRPSARPRRLRAPARDLQRRLDLDARRARGRTRSRCARDTGLPAAVLLEAILAVDRRSGSCRPPRRRSSAPPPRARSPSAPPLQPADPMPPAKLYADSMIAVIARATGYTRRARSSSTTSRRAGRRPTSAAK